MNAIVSLALIFHALVSSGDATLLKSLRIRDFEEYVEQCLPALAGIDGEVHDSPDNLAMASMLVFIRSADPELSARDNDDITDMLLGALQVLCSLITPFIYPLLQQKCHRLF
jgi:hypothetical protein